MLFNDITNMKPCEPSTINTLIKYDLYNAYHRAHSEKVIFRKCPKAQISDVTLINVYN